MHEFDRLSAEARRLATQVRLRGPLAGDPVAEILHALMMALVCWTILYVPIVLPAEMRMGPPLTADVLLALGSLLALVLLRQGRLRNAAMSFLIATWAIDTSVIVFSGGIRSPAVALYAMFPISAAWLLGLSASLWAAAICLGSGLALALLEQRGILIPGYSAGVSPAVWAEFLRTALISTVPVAWILNAFRSSLARSESAEADLRTYQDRLQKMVDQRTLELVDTQRAKNVFLANISHELRTPLHAILGFSTLVHDAQGLPEEHRGDLDIVNRSGEHLLTLIDEVLDTTQIEAGRAVLEVAPVCLRDLLHEVTSTMRVWARAKRLDLHLEIAPDVPVFVRTDAMKLRQVLVNMAGNAVKYTEKGSVTVRVSARETGLARRTWVELAVLDTGIGIAPQDQSSIFSPLTEAAVQDGTRLGLSITRHFVQLMGGALAVESTAGKGSLFRVELPMELATAAEVSALDKSRQVTGLAPGQPQCRILIVQDRPENWLLLRRLLLDAGFQVQVAEDGMHGIEIFQSWRPHLIWMDSRLPLMDGLEAARRIRQLEGGGDVRIIGLTASAHTHQRTEALAAGMDDFLRLPYRPDEIFGCMARHLRVRYLHGAEDFPVPPEPVPELSPGALASLPEDLRLELTEAVVTLETTRVAELIDRVTALNGELGSMLAQCASRFAYTDIFRALTGAEGYKSGAAHAN